MQNCKSVTCRSECAVDVTPTASYCFGFGSTRQEIGCSTCRYSIGMWQTAYTVCLQYRYCSYSLSRWARIAYWTEDTRARRGRKKRCQTMERAILFFLFFSFSWRVASHLAQLKKAKANSPDDFTHMHVCHSRKVLVNRRAVAFTGLRWRGNR